MVVTDVILRHKLEIEVFTLDTQRLHADWSEDEVWGYIRAFEVPYNALHDQGYRSIGCAPCTRPTVAGEDVRAGRWWWEIREARECGLHAAPDGRLVRTQSETEAA